MDSDGPVSEQAQLASLSHDQALPSLREVFGTEGWNPFSFKGKEVPMTDENIGFRMNFLMEEIIDDQKLKKKQKRRRNKMKRGQEKKRLRRRKERK